MRGRKQVVLWFKSNADEVEACAKEWKVVVDPLPEGLGLPRQSVLGISVLDKDGEVITLCVHKLFFSYRLISVS